MPIPENLIKAQFREIRWVRRETGGSVYYDTEEIDEGMQLAVQFNPETLTVNFTNQKAGGDRSGPSALQYVGQGTTKLSLELWFDATVSDDVDDVRILTDDVNYFMRPENQGTEDDPEYKIPGLKFIWGTFLFEGVMDSMSETLEYFSEDGVPLRAKVTVGISSQDIQFQRNGGSSQTPGTQPQQPVTDGDTMQDMAEAAGKGNDWQKLAAANGIENPRQLSPGALIDLNIDIEAGIKAGLEIDAGIEADLDLTPVSVRSDTHRKHWQQTAGGTTSFKLE